VFAKLTSTRLTPNRVPRQTHLELRAEPMLGAAPAHANDNHVTRHGPDGATHRPVLTCRWVPSAAGGLECRWVLADGEASRQDETADAARVRRPVATGRRRLTLAAGWRVEPR
jgi:hypothetical protein